jgi:hypothetical protein
MPPSLNAKHGCTAGPLPGKDVPIYACFTIGSGLGVAIMMNNYFHDMATSLLVGSGFALHAIP